MTNSPAVVTFPQIDGGKFVCESVVKGRGPEVVDDWVATMAGYNFLHFAIFLFGFFCTLLVVVSYLTAPPDEEQLRGLTYATLSDEDQIRPVNSKCSHYHRWTAELIQSLA